MNTTLSDASILGAGGRLPGRMCKERRHEGTRQFEGMAGSLEWLEHSVYGTLILSCFHGQLSLYLSVQLPGGTGNFLKAETVYLIQFYVIQ